MENDTPRRMPNVPPFVKFVCANVPMVFDDSLSYYEALCALWKYVQGMTDVINNNATLEEEFIEKFNVLQGKFVELKNYVDTYFDNLDVQEEINNKLDEMAEDGTLADIISQYLNSTAIFGYDTVADMKAAENLISGSYARTLGYYTKNDGGAALYKIRDITNDDVVDEASIIEMGDGSNQLVAELINDGDINIKQFGAYGDGTHEDSTAFTKAINYLKAGKTTSDYSSINTLKINGGKYKISNTVDLSVFVRIETIGYVTIESYCAGTTFRLSPDEADKDTGIDRYNYLFGSLIDGSKGLRVVNKLDSRGSTIAFALGADNATDSNKSYNLSKTSFRYITINNFDTAIKIYPINFYINDFHNIYCEQNNKTIVVGNSDGTYFDSGENISFNNSTFAGCDVVCQYDTPQQAIDFNFNECSFDYNKCLFYSPNNNESTSPARKISIDNSHIEAVSHGVTSDATPHGILYGRFRAYQITISNSRILQTNKYHLFYSDNATSYTLNLISNIISTWSDADNKNPNYQYLATDTVKNINVFNNSCSTTVGVVGRLVGYSNCIIRPDWRDIATGTTYTLTRDQANGTQMGDFKNAFFNAIGNPEVVENAFGGKSLKFTVDLTNGQWDPYHPGNYASIAMQSNKFRVKAGDKIGLGMLYKNIHGDTLTMTVQYFDYAGTQISSEAITTPLSYSADYQNIIMPRYSQAPVGAYECQVRFNCTQNSTAVNGDTFEYGNLSIVRM